VQWELGGQTTLGEPDREKSTQQRVVFHVDLPAAIRGQNSKAEKIVHKLHLFLKNEW